MYARFLREASGKLADGSLLTAAEMIDRSGKLFSEIANLFSEILEKNDNDLSDRIKRASVLFEQIAALEDEAFSLLADSCGTTG